MAKFKFNIFFVISIVCMFTLIIYLWIFFLPIFEGTPEYDAVKNIAIVLTILLSVSVILTLFQMRGD